MDMSIWQFISLTNLPSSHSPLNRKLIMKFILAIVTLLCLSTGWAAEKLPTAPATLLKGQVLEVKDVESYTYLRLKTKDGETWAAVSKTPVKKGAEVTIENTVVMKNFESKSLKKTFDSIVFGNIASTDSSAHADMANPHGATAKAVDLKDVKVSKATGSEARNVSEIVTQRAALKDKTVLLRGKVVKFSPEIMGKNWIHLRDGSGSDADNTNDVLVTSKDQVKVGDVVLVKGVVHTDKDLGSGYFFKVLIEDATLTLQK